MIGIHFSFFHYWSVLVLCTLSTVARQMIGQFSIIKQNKNIVYKQTLKSMSVNPITRGGVESTPPVFTARVDHLGFKFDQQ